MLLSRRTLQRVLGAPWLIDGLLQLQRQMFTMNMVKGIMKPMLQGQPGLFEPSLQFIVTQTTLLLRSRSQKRRTCWELISGLYVTYPRLCCSILYPGASEMV